MADSWAPTESVKAPVAATPPAGSNSWAPSPVNIFKNPGLAPIPGAPTPPGMGSSDVLRTGVEYGSEALPVAGGAIGSMFGPPGAAVGAGAGAVLRCLLYTSPSPR